MTSPCDVNLKKKKKKSQIHDVSPVFPAMAAGAGPWAAPTQEDNNPRAGPDVRAPPHRNRDTKSPKSPGGNRGARPGCSRASVTKYGLPPRLIWGPTSRRSLYKAGNPQRGTLTELKFRSLLSVCQHKHRQEVNTCCCLHFPDDAILIKSC